MKGSVRVEHNDGEYLLADMPPFSMGVLTWVPDGQPEYPGDVVIRIQDEFEFLGDSNTWAGEDGVDGYHFRPLRDGERVIITNDNQTQLDRKAQKHHGKISSVEKCSS